MSVKLASVAIIRNGNVQSRGFKSHGELRAALGDKEPYVQKMRPDDEEGFMTSDGKFLSRADAVPVAVKAGQLDQRWLNVRRPLLSSDLSW